MFSLDRIEDLKYWLTDHLQWLYTDQPQNRTHSWSTCSKLLILQDIPSPLLFTNKQNSHAAKTIVLKVIILFFRKICKYRDKIFKLLHINPLISVYYYLLHWLSFSLSNSDKFLMGIPNSICHQQKKFLSNQMRERSWSTWICKSTYSSCPRLS